MSSNANHGNNKAPISRSALLAITPLLFAVGAGVVILTIISIIAMPKPNPGTQYGVGADGFKAFIEEKSDIGAGALVTKGQVMTALGAKAKSVGDRDVSKVFNLNGDRSQTVTYPFVRADGTQSTLYIDMKLYKNPKALEDDNIYVATAAAGTVNGHPAYYKHAQTLDNNREYHMIVVNGLHAYRFVIAQPYTNVTITEVGAVASLKKLALEAKL